MCLAAKTPSTIAQQNAATTPKLMKTMEATNWKRRMGGWGGRGALASSLFITLTCLYLSSANMEQFDFPSATRLFVSSRLCTEGQQEDTHFHQPTGSTAGFSHSPFFLKLSFESIFGCTGPHPVCRVAGGEGPGFKDQRWTTRAKSSTLQHSHQKSLSKTLELQFLLFC